VPSPEQTDALYDVLGVARRFLAAELRLEHAGPDREALRLDRNEALQRLRDTLAETRPLLLGASLEISKLEGPRCGAVDSFEPDGGATCELDAGHEDRWHKAGHKIWTDFERRELVEEAA
jgi:hypothetical protein